jgi:uncharacterized protein YbjT (DUF2867 family)
MNVIAPPAKLLVIGATGSIGRLVLAGHCEVIECVPGARSAKRSGCCRRRQELVVGDVTQPETLTDAVDGVDAIVSPTAPMAAARRIRATSTTARYATHSSP